MKLAGKATSAGPCASLEPSSFESSLCSSPPPSTESVVVDCPLDEGPINLPLVVATGALPWRADFVRATELCRRGPGVVAGRQEASGFTSFSPCAKRVGATAPPLFMDLPLADARFGGCLATASFRLATMSSLHRFMIAYPSCGSESKYELKQDPQNPKKISGSRLAQMGWHKSAYVTPIWLYAGILAMPL
eukprot:scaffold259550_cov33-Tisochrysis_lutea.AAC.3